LRSFYKLHKKVPRSHYFRYGVYAEKYVPQKTVYRFFGSWSRALHMAGFSVKERNREMLGMRSEMMAGRN